MAAQVAAVQDSVSFTQDNFVPIYSKRKWQSYLQHRQCLIKSNCIPDELYFRKVELRKEP